MDGVNCFDVYLSLCTRFQLPPPWDCVPADSHAYNGPADPTVALVELLKDYSAEVLIAAGIAQPDAAGDPEIHPFLSAPCTPIIALRDRHSLSVNNLMTDSGCVRGYQYPIFAALLDDHCFRAIKETRPELLLTDDIVDSIILRSLGFASVPIVGLSKINEYGLNLLDRLFAVERFSNDLDLDGPCTSRTPSPSELAEAQRVYPPDQWWVLPGPNELINQDEDHVRISIVTWSLRALSLAEPVAIRTALQYLRELEAFCDLPIYEIQQWSPTSHQMASLQFALKQRNFGWAKKAVRESLVSSSDGLPSARRNNPPPDLTTALEEVQQAFACEANSGFWPRCKSALAAYQLAIQRVVLGPLVGQTQGITDPMERAMHAQLADLYCLFTNAMFPMRERMFAGLQPYPSSTQTDDGKALSNSLAISKQILTLTSQILQCRHHKPRPRPTQRTTSGSPPWSFAGSDSAMMN